MTDWQGIGTPAAAATGFCTVADIEAFLQVDVPAEGMAAANRAIAEVTEAIRNYCHQYISEVEDDTWTFDVPEGRTMLFLPELPVTEVSTVVEDGETLTEGSDEDYQVANFGIIKRVGADWVDGTQIVTVTYTHGYDTIPDDIVAVATRAAARAYQAGLRSAESEGVPGVVSKSLGDFAVTFSAEGGGGVSEGVLGASASRMLLLSEKDILNRYRYIAQ